MDAKQLELLLAGLEASLTATPAVTEPVPTSTRTALARPIRQPLLAHLEIERVVFEPAEMTQQPEGWRKLGEEGAE